MVRSRVTQRRCAPSFAVATFILLFAAVCSASDLLPPMNGYSSDFARRRAGEAVQAAVQIRVGEGGLYRLDRLTLVNAGVPGTALVGSNIRMFNRDNEIAILVSTNGMFSGDDHVLFVAEEYESGFTRTNVYWLGFGGGGARMASRSVQVVAAGSVVTSTQFSVSYAEEALYVPYYRALDATLDHWFAAFMRKDDEAYNQHNVFDVSSVGRLTGGTSILSVVLHGVSSDETVAPDHRTSIGVNGWPVGDGEYDGQHSYSGAVSFPSDLLNDGPSTLSFTQTQEGVQADLDTAFLESCRLEYPRRLSCESGSLTFQGCERTNTYRIAGVAGPDVRLLDVTDPVSPVHLLNFSTQAETGGTLVVSFGDVTPMARRYMIVDEGAVRDVASVRRVPFRDLASTSRQADYVLVCPYRLREHCYRLLKHRYLHGLSVAVAPIEDIYNEFSYGIVDAGAIKQFLGYAFHHWAAPPRYVLLAGEGTYDPKANLGATGQNVLPVRLGPTSWQWTALENWFVLVNGQDELADMAIGRIPVTDNVAMGNVVDKIIEYEAAVTNAGTWLNKATLVADDWDGQNDFGAASDDYVFDPLGSAGFTTRTRVYLDSPTYADPSLARAAIASGFSIGRYLFSFFGHGAVDFWTQEDVWNTSDANGLGNSVRPIVAMFTCQTGYFIGSTKECIAEALLERANGGAVACFAPSILGRQDFSEYVADGFMATLTGGTAERIGDAQMGGLSNLWVNGNDQVEELRAYQVFGDPATFVKRGN